MDATNNRFYREKPMGMLEDDVTEAKRMGTRDAKIKKLEMALASCVRAMRDVQDHQGDPGSWMHNRLLTPLLIYSDTIAAAEKRGNR